MDQAKPTLPGETQDEIDKLDALEEELRATEQQIVDMSQQLAVLDSVEIKIQLFSEDVASFNADVATLLKQINLGEQEAAFAFGIPEGHSEILARRKTELQSTVSALKEAGGSNGARALPVVQAEIKAIKDRSHLAQEGREAFDKYQKDHAELAETLASVQRELAEIDQSLIPMRKTEKDARVEKYLDSFALLDEEKKTLERHYEPLRSVLLAGTETDQKLAFIARFAWDTVSFAQRGLDIIDRTRKGQYREDGVLEARLKQLWAILENEDFQRESVRREIEEFRRSFETDETEPAVRISDQLRKGKSVQDFDDWFFDTDYFSVVYSMKFEGKDLQLLSPGQKGIVLLLVYLEVDQSDNRPLIIDQPEDNLDNLSVYRNLIDYFRKRKKTRQIIIITHNPNLVVNTDAEQMIVANFDGSAAPKIAYVSGAIEDTRNGPLQGVRERVCDVLEGGTEAFQRREQKYSLAPM